MNVIHVFGANSAGCDQKEVEMIYCPAAGNSGTNPNLPKASCEAKQLNPQLPHCYGGCHFINKTTKTVEVKKRARLIDPNSPEGVRKRLRHVDKILEMMRDGLQQKEICKELERSKGFVSAVVRELREASLLPPKHYRSS